MTAVRTPATEVPAMKPEPLACTRRPGAPLTGARVSTAGPPMRVKEALTAMALLTPVAVTWTTPEAPVGTVNVAEKEPELSVLT